MRCGAVSATRHCWSVLTCVRAPGRCAAAKGECSARFARMAPQATRVPGHAHRSPRDSPRGAADRGAQPEALQGVRELPERSRRRRVQSARTRQTAMLRRDRRTATSPGRRPYRDPRPCREAPQDKAVPIRAPIRLSVPRERLTPWRSRQSATDQTIQKSSQSVANLERWLTRSSTYGRRASRPELLSSARTIECSGAWVQARPWTAVDPRSVCPVGRATAVLVVATPVGLPVAGDEEREVRPAIQDYLRTPALPVCFRHLWRQGCPAIECRVFREALHQRAPFPSCDSTHY